MTIVVSPYSRLVLLFTTCNVLISYSHHFTVVTLSDIMAASEEVLLMVSNVKHRKVEGTMYMMDKRMAWQQRGKDVFNFSHM